MAHMNRGSSPINLGGGGEKGVRGSVFYSHRRYYPRYYFLTQLIILIIMFIVLGLMHIFMYKTSFEDPIESIKSTYINLLMGAEITILVFMMAITSIFKIKEKLVVALKLILIVSLCIVSIFGIEIISYNNTYNKEKFEEFYNSSLNMKELNEPKNTLEITGIKITNAKESYTNECLEAYKTFQIKVAFLFIIFVAIICLNIYLLINTANKQSKEEKLRKDDIVVYDEEENVKF